MAFFGSKTIKYPSFYFSSLLRFICASICFRAPVRIKVSPKIRKTKLKTTKRPSPIKAPSSKLCREIKKQPNPKKAIIPKTPLIRMILPISNILFALSIFFITFYYTSSSTKKTSKRTYFFEMVGICGLEPQTSSLSVTRSNQLSYIPELILYILLPAPTKIKHKPRIFLI